MREDQEDSFMSLPAQKSTIEAQPLIAVRNVRASSRWYGELLGANSIPEHPHRDVYDRISHSGQLLLQLHAWDAEDHPNLVNADAAPPGHGVLLWFQVDDFDAVVERVRARGRKSSRNRTSTLRPGTEKFGSAIRMVTWWWLPVRTVNAAPNLRTVVAMTLAGDPRGADLQVPRAVDSGPGYSSHRQSGEQFAPNLTSA